MDHQYTKEELDALSKDTLITLLLSMQTELGSLRKEVTSMNEKMSVLLERLDTSNMKAFGRSTEKLEELMDDRLFNEAEAVADADPDGEEPDFDEVMSPELKRTRQKKTAGKRKKDLSAFQADVIYHRVSEEDLRAAFGEKAGNSCLILFTDAFAFSRQPMLLKNTMWRCMPAWIIPCGNAPTDRWI